jgi:pimeloyl-ACP methyl ester carboxylesterase
MEEERMAVRRSALILVALCLMVAAAAVAAPEGDARSADGVSIRYHTEGAGEPALVFVHCWTCDRHLWDGQVARFAKDHQVVTLDLAGHGESGKNRQQWTIPAFGEDVKAVVEALKLNKVVLIGHSMGASVILEAAKQMPGRVVGLVPVEALATVDDRMPAEQIDTILGAFRENFGAAARRFAEMQVVDSTAPALRERISKGMAASPPDIAIPTLSAIWHYDARPLLAVTKVPVVGIVSDRFPPKLADLRKYAPQAELLTLPGVGHYVMEESPDKFNDLLAQALGKFGPAK